LASARAAFHQLKQKPNTVTAKKFLLFTEEGLKACYFSRQKIVYAKCLAAAIQTKQLS